MAYAARMAQPDLGGRRRRPRRGDEKEAAILRTAWQLLATQPVAAITIEQLATGAGISRPTFYFYFDSRDAVIRALAATAADQLTSAVTGQLTARDKPVPVAVRRAVEAYLDLWKQHGPVLRAMVPLYETDPALRAFWDDVAGRVTAELAAYIEDQRAAGRALPGPPAAKDLAHALGAMLWRAGYELSLAASWTRSRKRLADTLTTIYLRAVFVSDAGSS